MIKQPTKRPVNLNLLTMHFPIAAIASIAHRISGVLLFLLIPVLLCTLQYSLQSPEAFAELSSWFAAPLIKLVVYFAILALTYHMLAGFRHLLMDFHFGETRQGGKIGAWLVIFLFIVIGVYLAVRMFL